MLWWVVGEQLQHKRDGFKSQQRSCIVGQLQLVLMIKYWIDLLCFLLLVMCDCMNVALILY